MNKLLEKRSLAPPSIALQELMLRYAQDGNVHGVAGCVRKGADPDYKQAQALQTSVYLGHIKLTKYLLKVSKQYNAAELLEIAQGMGHTKVVALLNKL